MWCGGWLCSRKNGDLLKNKMHSRNKRRNRQSHWVIYSTRNLKTNSMPLMIVKNRKKSSCLRGYLNDWLPPHTAVNGINGKQLFSSRCTVTRLNSQTTRMFRGAVNTMRTNLGGNVNWKRINVAYPSEESSQLPWAKELWSLLLPLGRSAPANLGDRRYRSKRHARSI